MKNYIYIFLTILTLGSCKDLFEEDISNETIILLTPSINEISNQNNIDFKWGDIEGAREYSIEIVSPSFDSVTSYVYDSNVVASNLILPLSPGTYQWRVQGINNSYQTEYSEVRNLTIDSNYDLTSQTVLLFTPSNSVYFNYSSINFSWQELYAAESYNVIIKDSDDWSTGTELVDVSVTATNYINIDSLTEGSYSWGISAENSLPSQTSSSSYRTFYIDQTNPNDPVTLTPNQTSINLFADSLIAMDWTRPADIGVIQSPITDWIEVYQDTLLQPVISTQVVQEDTTLTFSTVGQYFWRVGSDDAANNYSNWSSFKSFNIQ